MQRSTFSRMAALAVLFVLPGCVSTAYVAEYSTDYNKAVETTNNQGLLLNVLRAMKRRPMYFSFVSTIRGGSGWSLAPSTLTIPFGAGAGATAHTLAAAAGYQGTSGFDVGVVDTQEFMRGFTTPISVKSVAYYWSQDWPSELLWLVFVKKIEIVQGTDFHLPPEETLMKIAVGDKPLPASEECRTDAKRCGKLLRDICTTETIPRCEIRGDKIVSIFNNYPESIEEFNRFLHASRQLLDPSFDLTPTASDPQNIGPELDANQAAAMEQALLRKENGDYSIVTLKAKASHPRETYQLQHTATGFSLAYPGGCTAETQEKEAKSTGEKAPANPTTKAVVPDEKSPPLVEPDDSCKNAPHLWVYLRSPEAMLYYLGEIARAGIRSAAMQQENPIQARMCIDSVPIFDIHVLKGTDTPSPLSVEYDGRRYGMLPQRDTQDRFEQCRQETTTQTLSLVSQVISLQKSVKDLPASNVVHVAP